MIERLKTAGLGYHVDDDKAIDKFGKSEKYTKRFLPSLMILHLNF